MSQVYETDRQTDKESFHIQSPSPQLVFCYDPAQSLTINPVGAKIGHPFPISHLSFISINNDNNNSNNNNKTLEDTEFISDSDKVLLQFAPSRPLAGIFFIKDFMLNLTKKTESHSIFIYPVLDHYFL